MNQGARVSIQRLQIVASLEVGKNNLVLEINENTHFGDISSIGAAAIKKLYKEFSKEYFAKRVKALNEKYYGFKVGAIRVKNQVTRFGSCSSKGNLNLNWKVVMAPTEAVDYLVVHELSHLREMNHSREFWKLVERGCPDYKKCRKWLRSRGHTLTI